MAEIRKIHNIKVRTLTGKELEIQVDLDDGQWSPEDHDEGSSKTTADMAVDSEASSGSEQAKREKTVDAGESGSDEAAKKGIQGQADSLDERSAKVRKAAVRGSKTKLEKKGG